MKKSRITTAYYAEFLISLACALLVLAGLWASAALASDITVKIGVYENAPKIFTGPSGKPAGIFIDIIEHIAGEEGWRLEYVPGTWGEGLDRLEKKEIDLMPDVAFTAEREKIFSFHKVPVLSSWFQVYSRKGGGIDSILDLDGKRIAVLERSVQQEAFIQIVGSFGLNITLIPLPDYQATFDLVARGEADAAITNRFYGLMHAQKLGLEDTSVIFSPSDLFFAAPRGLHEDLLNAIDSRLTHLKKDSQSVYYQSLKRWTSEEVRFQLPSWLKVVGLVSGVVLLMSLAGSVVLKRQVNARTEELFRRNEQMIIMDRMLRATTTSLNLRDVLEKALRGALEITGLEGGFLCLTDNQTGQMTIGASVNTSPELTAELGNLASQTGNGSLSQAVHRGDHLIFGENTPEVNRIFSREGIRFNTFFPLEVRTETIGVICLFSHDEVKLDPVKSKLVQEICSPVALAIENANLYAQVSYHAEELEQEVAVRTAELEVAMVKAQAADHLKSAFLATMSHELRTPLNSIIGFTGILLQGLAGPLNEEQKKQMTMVQSSSRHLLALINDVLDISKIEAGQLALSFSSFELRPSIEKMIKLISPLAEQKGIKVKLEIADDFTAVTTDQRRLEQVILNLLNNAVKFTDKGQVNVVCRADDSNYLVSISDTGIGIKPEDIPGLFQPFHQLDTGLSRKHEGTGLGLSICKKLMDMMGGAIEVQSEPGRGSTFTMRFPRRASPGDLP